MDASFCVVNTDERTKDLISFNVDPTDHENENEIYAFQSLDPLSSDNNEIIFEADLLSVTTESSLPHDEIKSIEDLSTDESAPCSPPSTRLIRQEIHAFENLRAKVEELQKNIRTENSQTSLQREGKASEKRKLSGKHNTNIWESIFGNHTSRLSHIKEVNDKGEKIPGNNGSDKKSCTQNASSKLKKKQFEKDDSINSTENSSTCKNQSIKILVVGASNSGKSSLIHKLTRDWKNNFSINEYFYKDEKDYDLVKIESTDVKLKECNQQEAAPEEATKSATLEENTIDSWLKNPSHSCTQITLQNKTLGEIIQCSIYDVPGVYESPSYCNKTESGSLRPALHAEVISAQKKIIEYVLQQSESYLNTESDPNRTISMTDIEDPRIDLIFFMIDPKCFTINDVHFMKLASSYVTLMPIVSKADLLTAQELKTFQDHLYHECHHHNISTLLMPTLNPPSKSVSQSFPFVSTVKEESMSDINNLRDIICNSRYLNIKKRTEENYLQYRKEFFFQNQLMYQEKVTKRNYFILCSTFALFGFCCLFTLLISLYGRGNLYSNMVYKHKIYIPDNLQNYRDTIQSAPESYPYIKLKKFQLPYPKRDSKLKERGKVYKKSNFRKINHKDDLRKMHTKKEPYEPYLNESQSIHVMSFLHANPPIFLNMNTNHSNNEKKGSIGSLSEGYSSKLPSKKSKRLYTKLDPKKSKARQHWNKKTCLIDDFSKSVSSCKTNKTFISSAITKFNDINKSPTTDKSKFSIQKRHGQHRENFQPVDDFSKYSVQYADLMDENELARDILHQLCPYRVVKQIFHYVFLPGTDSTHNRLKLSEHSDFDYALDFDGDSFIVTSGFAGDTFSVENPSIYISKDKTKKSYLDLKGELQKKEEELNIAQKNINLLLQALTEVINLPDSSVLASKSFSDFASTGGNTEMQKIFNFLLKATSNSIVTKHREFNEEMNNSLYSKSIPHNKNLVLDSEIIAKSQITQKVGPLQVNYFLGWEERN